MAVEVDIMNRYKTNPRVAQFFISAIAEREYLDAKEAINEQYKKLNKGK
jgi:capsule polysaccharide modification protein KpsS